MKIRINKVLVQLANQATNNVEIYIQQYAVFLRQKFSKKKRKTKKDQVCLISQKTNLIK